MTAGNPCSIAEFGMFMDQYEYVQDRNDQHRWLLNDPESRNAEEPCAIVLGDLSAPAETIDVFGQGSEHFTNLNYLMQRGGWKSCSVVCRSADISAKMLARFVSVDVTSDFSLPASRLDANQQEQPSKTMPAPHVVVEDAVVSAVVQPQAEAVNDPGSRDTGENDALVELEAANHRLRELTIQLNAAQEMLATSQCDNTALQEHNESLQSQVQRSTQQLAAQHAAATFTTRSAEASADPAGSPLLTQIIEEYLLPTVDLSTASSSKLLADLRAAGFSVQLRLVRSA
jgi:hypothetical protein